MLHDPALKGTENVLGTLFHTGHASVQTEVIYIMHALALPGSLYRRVGKGISEKIEEPLPCARVGTLVPDCTVLPAAQPLWSARRL